MNENIKQAIVSLLDNDIATFKSMIDDELANRVNERIEGMKPYVANEYFTGIDDVEEE